MKIKLEGLDPSRAGLLTRQADKMATELEAQRDLDSVCMVVDMVRPAFSSLLAAVGVGTNSVRVGGEPQLFLWTADDDGAAAAACCSCCCSISLSPLLLFSFY